MPAPTNERQALERERAERREMLEWQVRRDQKRMAEIEARLAAMKAER